MKKTLIALAAVAASTGAMAQATISGSFDISAIANGKITTQSGSDAAVDAKGSQTAQQNTWTTSQIVFSASEDLGGGLRATAVMSTGIAGTSSFADRDTHLTLAGKFGSVRMGRFVPAAALGFHGFSGAASTAVGSIYGLATASTFTATTADRFGNRLGGSFERNNNNIQFTSPSFNGVTFNANYGSNSSDASATGFGGKDKTTQSGISIAYAAGPLSIGAGTNDRKVERQAQPIMNICVADATGAVSLSLAACSNARDLGDTVAVTARTLKSEIDWVGASYDFGAARVFATQVNRTDKNSTDSTTQADIKITSMGVTVPMGAITLSASTYSGKNKQTSAANDNTKLSGHQVSVRYALSKRTTVYALMGENKIARDGATTATATRKETGSMIGVLHTF